jgi:large subunit ribosomal protein L21
MYAIIETGGKQYRVEEGTTLQVETLHADEGSSVEIRPVRFISGDLGPIWGQPIIEGAHVKATILRNGRTRSITVFKKKRRKNYRRTKGHRQEFSQVRIDQIVSA